MSAVNRAANDPVRDSDEWFGEPHTLVVTSVTPPEGQWDDGEMEYEIEHPPSCKTRTVGEGEHSYTEWVCDVAFQIDQAGLPWALRYSGTPITEPGTYRIQTWGNRHYIYDAWAYEYDGSIGVMDYDQSGGRIDAPSVPIGPNSGGES